VEDRSVQPGRWRGLSLALVATTLAAVLVIAPSATPASAKPSCLPYIPQVTKATISSLTISIQNGYCKRSGPGAPAGFRLYESNADGTAVASFDLAPSTTSFVRTVDPGEFLTFRLAAFDNNGEGPSTAESMPAVAPFKQFDAYYDRLYRDFYWRAPTATETYNAMVNLKSAFGADDVTDHFWNAAHSSPFAKKQSPVIRLFRAYFGRNPDLSGLNYWTNRYRNGTSLNVISSSFATSSEFLRTYGQLSNQAFVELVYRNVLGRAPDPAGLASWTGKLDSKAKNRGQVMVGFSESSEFTRRTGGLVFLINLYTGMVRRMPTADEATWANLMITDSGSKLVTRTLYASPEYVDRVT
jgi:hypothetical protein